MPGRTAVLPLPQITDKNCDSGVRGSKKLPMLNHKSQLIKREKTVTIIDYYNVDLAGETFRSPYGRVNDHHLDDFACINILVFEK